MSINEFSGNIRKVEGDMRLGDDIYNYNFSERKNKAQFEKLALGPDHFNDYLRPSFTDDIIGRLKAQQILLVGGNYAFNKGHFLKYLAVNARTEEQEVKECTHVPNFHGLFSAIYEETKSSVLILNYLSPREINYKFKELKDIAGKRNHTIIISTDDAYESWNFEEGVLQSHWFEIPEKDIYSPKVLLEYFTGKLKEKRIDLAFDSNRIVHELTSTAQLDRFIELLQEKKHKPDEAGILQIIQLCKDIDSDSIQQWFDNLSGQHKLIAIGIALFDGAYENQFFAGFERILNTAWRKRDKTLKSIDYEDLIPLTVFFKMDGISIKSKLKGQRAKIIKLAWRTHKRYILSALPVLMDIVFESADAKTLDWELFPTENYRSNIRNVLSGTFGDIGLHSFEDIESILLYLATSPNILPQIVVAKAISGWILFDENKIYEILDRWQYNVELRQSMKFYKQEQGQNDYNPLSYIQATVILTLYFVSQYEVNGELSQEKKDLLLRFLNNKDRLVVERMQWTLDMLATRHPDSMAELLKNKFLLYRYYVDPIAVGLANAYNNGFALNVKTILESWMKYYDDNTPALEAPESYTHRDKILSVVISVLGRIDYAKVNLITVKYAYDILENYRKKNHKHVIREYLIKTLVNIIEVNFYANEGISIDMISNIDEKERKGIVAEFVDKYLQQRKELKNGDYEFAFNDDYVFQVWEEPDNRPRTPVEKLLIQWKKNESHTLSQIALSSFVEFDRIEAKEQLAIEDYYKRLDDDKDRREKRRKELEEMGAPKYDGDIKTTAETDSFIKLCKRFVREDQEGMLHNIAIFILQEKLTEKEAERLIVKIDDAHDSNSSTVKNIFFVYKLYRNSNFNTADNPLHGDYRSVLMVTLSYWMVSADKRKLLKAFTPFLMDTNLLTGEDINQILTKVKPGNIGWVKLTYRLCKHPLLLVLLIIIIFFMLNKLLNLWN